MNPLHTVFYWLESFERDGHVENAAKRLLSDDELVVAKEWIDALPEQEQMMLKGRLTKLFLACAHHQRRLVVEMDALRNKIIINREAMHAHMAYLQAASMRKPNSLH